MGWCHEFGVQIRPDCGHPMQADSTSCVCVECGTVCRGHFGGCPDVWARGPIPVTLIPPRPGSVPHVENRESVLVVSTPSVDDDEDAFAPREPRLHTVAVEPQAPEPARERPSSPDREKLLAWLVTTFRDIQRQVQELSDGVVRQQAVLAELASTREGDRRVVELAATLPDRLGAAIAAAIEARQEGYLQRFDEVVNTIATQLASSLPKRLGSAIADAVEERQEVMVRLVERNREELEAHLGDTLSDVLARSLPKHIADEAAIAIETREQALVSRLDEIVEGLAARVAQSIAEQLEPALTAATDAGHRVLTAQLRNATAELQGSLADVQASAAELSEEARALAGSPELQSHGGFPRGATVEQAVDRAVHSVLRRAGGGSAAEDRRHPSVVPASELEDVGEAKAAMRAKVWTAMTKAKAARFPGAEGRIPNFVGAEAAAELLQQIDEWTRAAVVKANPDAPQWPVRERVLADGKLLYMAVPRLASDEPFYMLDGEDLDETPRRASSIKGAARVAETVALDQLEPIDMVVTGCVAVGRDGARLGKGGGYSDLEFALLTQAGVIGSETLVVTTAHDLQVHDAGEVPTAPHDLWVDLIVTASEVIRCTRDGERPGGRLRWEQVSDEQLAAIPVLRELKPA